MLRLDFNVGIAADTGFFRFNSTNPEAHRIAAELIEHGVDQAAAYRALHERNSVAYTRLLGYALSRLRMDRGTQIASVSLERTSIEALDALDVDTSEIMSARSVGENMASLPAFCSTPTTTWGKMRVARSTIAT